MSTRPFLTAEWRDLIMANYIVDPSLLSMYLPSKTELDFYDGQCYVSLVGFMFRNVRVMGLSIPLHTDFPEINLRFYVRYKSNNEWRRGVVFIKEIVPKRAITLIANTFFGERYVTMPAMHKRKQESGNLTVSCVWKSRNWNELMVLADENKRPLREASEEEFITQHFWGYSSTRKKETVEYEVAHPKWESYPVKSYTIDCDFESLYGSSFGYLSQIQPESVMLAEGSEIAVFNKRII